MLTRPCNTDTPKQNINTPKPTVLFNYIFKGDKHILIVWLSLPYSIEFSSMSWF